MASISPSIVNSPVPQEKVKSLFGQIAQTNYYEVQFSGFKSITTSTTSEEETLQEHLGKYTFKDSRSFDFNKFITGDLGLLCCEASLPTSSYATAEVKDNFMGVTQEFAHTRLYSDVDFSFYVDKDYNALRFFEGWMDYISGTGAASENEESKRGYFRRFRYPDSYKMETMFIQKFNRDIRVSNSKVLQYRFVNVFPKTITSIPVSYGPAEIMKVTITFNYDRYTVGRTEVKGEPKSDSTQQRVETSEDLLKKYTREGISLQAIKEESEAFFGRSFPY